MKHFAILFLLSGCLVSEKDYGPTATVTLTCDDFSTSDGSEPLLEDDTTHDFPITIEIDIAPGSKTVRNSEDDTHYPVTSIDATLGDTQLSFSDFTTSDESSDYEQVLMSNDPVTLPGSAAGSTLQVTFDMTDSRGLHTNTIDFAVELQAD
ncbi:MAG TPA: hypothetical protein VGM88_14905 [Kofleriaceae bacterium]|jgi:hypothetical protein